MSLSSILKEHQDIVKSRSEEQERLRRDTVESAKELTDHVVSFFLLFNDAHIINVKAN